jgi:hypothetical protein
MMLSSCQPDDTTKSIVRIRTHNVFIVNKDTSKGSLLNDEDRSELWVDDIHVRIIKNWLVVNNISYGFLNEGDSIRIVPCSPELQVLVNNQNRLGVMLTRQQEIELKPVIYREFTVGDKYTLIIASRFYGGIKRTYWGKEIITIGDHEVQFQEEKMYIDGKIFTTLHKGDIITIEKGVMRISDQDKSMVVTAESEIYDSGHRGTP